MIRLFDRDETEFNHNETILNDAISAEPDVMANGMYELVLEYPRNEFAKQLTEGKIIKAPTPNGDQLFRIYKPIKNLTTYTIYARHIFYDLLTNFIEDVRPTKKSGSGALQDILNGAQIDQGFTGVSDISNTGTAYYVRMSPVKALLGASNSFVNVWGGELVRDNHTIKILANAGQDRGYEVRVGKNLTGIEVTTDDSTVYTRIYPTVVIDDQTVTTLPEKYVDSPLVGQYEYPRIIEERISLTDGEKELPLDEIYELMRKHVEDLFEAGLDKPEVNLKVDFVELSQTEQYKHLKILEQLDLYDMVSVYVKELDVEVMAKVIKYKYDSIRKKYLNMELGSFKADGSSQTKNTITRIDKKVSDATSYLQQAFDEAQDMITGNLGGHLITRLNAEGKPYELLVMDTEDIQTAKNVIRLNQQGIGFSENGYNGPFGVAITIDGKLNAEIINVFNLSAAVLRTGILRGYNDLFSLDMDTGKVVMKDAELTGNVNAQTGYIGDWTIEDGVIHSPLASGLYTTLKATGNVALGLGSPKTGDTNSARLQLWHSGIIRFMNSDGTALGRIYSGETDKLTIQTTKQSQMIKMDSYYTEFVGYAVPGYTKASEDAWALGTSEDKYRWHRVYAKNNENVESDARLKRDMQPIPNSLSKYFSEVEAKMFHKDSDKWSVGYSAQDIEAALFKFATNELDIRKTEDLHLAHELVEKFDLLGKNNRKYRSLTYAEIAVLKNEEQSRRIQSLEKQVKEQQSKNNELEERLSKLEELIR